MDCNGTDVYAGILVSIPVLLESLAARVPQGSFIAAPLLSTAALVREGAGRLHMPLIGRLARLGASLARPLFGG
jgi:hypothetical protein